MDSFLSPGGYGKLMPVETKREMVGFDSAMRRFECSRPSQLISLRFLLFCRHHFQRSWEFFVLFLISLRLVPIQFCNRV